MRVAQAIMLAGALVSPLPLTAAEPAQQRPERQVACTGLATGERGEEVAVSMYIEPDGTLVGVSSSWRPPLLARIGGTGLDQPDLQLTLLYSDMNARSIGKTESASVSVFLFSPPRNPVSEAKLNARLDGLIPSISYDGAAAERLKYDPPNSLLMVIPGTARRFVAIDFPSPLPREATITLADRKGKPVLSQRYATRDTTNRDALFTQASKEAVAASGNMMGCDLTAESRF